jgi:endonuclease/exonuclease/phosphatase family metal-dependent hydrolase
MTYNIHRWAGVDRRIDIARLAEVIRTSGADVVGLNEVLHPVAVGQRTYEPLRELTEHLGMIHAFGPSGWTDQGPSWHGAVGNALLSRFPLEDITNTWLPRAAGTKQRSMLRARLAGGPARGLVAYVTHLDHAWEGTRLLQVDGVLRSVNRQHPHFVCGDFNTPGFLGQHSRALLPPVLRRMRRAGYQDAFYAVGTGSGHTFPSAAPVVRFDFLFLPGYWARGLRSAHTVNQASIGKASDHRPVLAEWAWPA